VDTALDELGAGDLQGVNDAVLAEDGLVDDVLEDQGLDPVLGDVVDATGTVDDVLGTEPLVQDVADGLVGEDGVVDDVVGADGPEGGVTDEAVEHAVADVDEVVMLLMAGDLPGVVGGVTAEDALVDDVLEDQGLDPVLGDVVDATGPVDDVLGTDPLVQDVADGLVGEDGVVDDVVGADGPEGGVTDEAVEHAVADVDEVVMLLMAGDLPGVVGGVTAEEGLVDDVLEDQGLDPVLGDVVDASGTVDDVLGTEPLVQDTVDGLVGEDGVVDDVVGADGPEGGVTDELVESVVEDADQTVGDLVEGDLGGVVDSVTAEDGLVDDVLEDQGLDPVLGDVVDASGTVDDVLGTEPLVQDTVDG
ncbi:hypothetical protein, partial [Isoptericola cucumis]|uniref:hypothetical protein n=1 Tax=Isoptericola cucumis TaxID=1776856 RepID=UPI0039EE9644